VGENSQKGPDGRGVDTRPLLDIPDFPRNFAWITSYSEAIEQVEEQGYYAFDSTTKHRHVFA